MTVLKFANPVTWNQSSTYQANTIVFNGRDAYTSLQNVPANTALTNTSYWKKTGVPSSSEIDGIESDVNGLKTTVGNQNSGLVKAVADNTGDISSLETTVGNSSSGLVKAVADNTGDIGNLKSTVGNNSSGLVHDVSSLQTTVGNSSSGLVKAVADNSGDISALQGTVGNSSSGLVKDVADNSTDIDNLENDMDNVKYTLYTPTN